jgi:hypothetical protein
VSANPTEPKPTSPKPTLLDRVKELPNLAKGLGAIVALIVSLIGLFTWAFPGCSRQAPGPTDGALKVLDLQKHVTLGEYLRTHPVKNANPSPAQRKVDGVVALVRAEGLSGMKRADVYSTVRDAASGADVEKHLAGRLKIRAAGDSGGGAFWIAAPSEPGSYYILFELDSPTGTLINTAKSESFSVGG